MPSLPDALATALQDQSALAWSLLIYGGIGDILRIAFANLKKYEVLDNSKQSLSLSVLVLPFMLCAPRFSRINRLELPTCIEMTELICCLANATAHAWRKNRWIRIADK